MREWQCGGNLNRSTHAHIWHGHLSALWFLREGTNDATGLSQSPSLNLLRPLPDLPLTRPKKQGLNGDFVPKVGVV